MRRKKYVKPRKQKQVARKRLKYILVAVAASILIGFFVFSVLNQESSNLFDQTPKVAIIDHLSIQFPNASFLQTIESIINQTGLKIDYYPGEQVTVDLYRDLALHNYKIVILRVHSTAECSVPDQPPSVVFFSSERFGQEYYWEKLPGQVVYVNFPNGDPTGYFGITPAFVKDVMKGRFNETIIIAMGCDGLNNTSMAEAFIGKGASAYIGWNTSVSADHTDQATASLLRHLIIDGQTVGNSVANTMIEVGPDPLEQSTLTFYPDSAANEQMQSSLLSTVSKSSDVPELLARALDQNLP